ncbi:lysophospholipid acyltransferase family protein [Laribacter hongkongensis]|uniref:Lysophospholipid acyltransferase family protein n=1 Tax=Laribacter hongkongensis TaxID=168471 RepID=A0ABD4SRX7_9NEIS|nr:lysophospholipid acyltransferase family protein [Laribacter hongkongensis]MCG9026197.1 lysophospholipid acyltransferase family protein [Laribacter hongkongensis]MCG9100703.1 lysophospholipid acyltransferase family protein [Laribacter hongkongensis]MCG9103235.1 lysophospholipid acyltransferase family protein [Laribacter hongkongensis]MCG9113932.1 lysophospholipid acyltransferase family protein [Laribacter hongkongensis]MCG9117529.1 lysophospholipid acyltransferase family protein [Laribacter 
MQYTVFDTPILRPLLALVARVGLRLSGWRVEGQFPADSRYVLIGAPHTSNWDFPLALGVCFACNVKIYWMGKSSLFCGLAGPVMRWLGGIPVNRDKPGGLVGQMITAFGRQPELVLAIPPEGTRSRVSEWKTGFYYIAQRAGVPVLPVYVDGARKVVGIAPLFYPTGDLEGDLPKIRAIYAGKQGIRAELS